MQHGHTASRLRTQGTAWCIQPVRGASGVSDALVGGLQSYAHTFAAYQPSASVFVGVEAVHHF